MTMTTEQVEVTVSARAAAIAWLNAFLATSQEEGRPTLYRTLALEVFNTGVQCIATNGYALFRTWVPSVAAVEEAEFDDEGIVPWPATSRQPQRAVVVMDPDGFGLGFMRALLRVTNDEAHAFEELTITTSPQDDEATLALGAEFMSERLTLRACGQRIDLKLLEGAYPNWRALQLGVEAVERVDGMTVGPRLLALVGKIKGATSVDLAFHGESKHIAFTAHGACEVRGMLMPMRREAERPAADPVREAVDAFRDSIPEGDSVTITAGGRSATLHGTGAR